ncbi:MAG: shikimate dehydrogenase [Clostridia bacterium]
MKIEKFAVIGHPITHTMSPFIHKTLFKLSGYEPVYDVLDIENVLASKQILSAYDGLNVTIPHKSNIIEILNDISPKALKFGSVNTVKIDDNKISGFTTDAQGCFQAFENAGINIKGKVVILGSGGAARALAYGLEDYDVEIIVAARSEEKARLITENLNSAQAINIDKLEKIGKIDILINATSVGMYPNKNACPVASDIIKKADTVFDAVYNPHETVFLQTAKKLNKKIVYGIDMLVFQAVKAHEIWYGASFKKEDILNLCKASQKECEKIFGVK